MRQVPNTIRKAAVLGAGNMGAKIAAHFANANIPVILFDLPSEKGDVNQLSLDSLYALKKEKPAAFAIESGREWIDVANYRDGLEQLQSCDLVIEAIAENLDWKHELYQKIAPHLHEKAILASNTSGLSVTRLAETLPKTLQPRFCGCHFFNPPRYMPLVELVPHPNTHTKTLDQLESFLVTHLGKSIIRAHDTPCFIANRIGVFSVLAACHHTQAFEIGMDIVDKLTGVRIGRPKSATYRTLDLVGLDVLSHVIATMQQQLPKDPWQHCYQTPSWIASIIESGALGQKTRKGLYHKTADGLNIWDLSLNDYRPVETKPDPEVNKILKEPNPRKRFTTLRRCQHPQAQFLWACFADMFHYSACCAAEIATSTRDIDLAMRWGFGWKQGPFELWQSIGWKTVTQWLKADIQAGKTLSKEPLPHWVSQIKQPYQRGKSYHFKAKTLKRLRTLPVYHRQLFPDLLPTERQPRQKTLFENEGLRLWSTGDNIGIISFKTKMNTINDAVLDGLMASVDYAQLQGLHGLIIWQQDQTHFSAGADLMQFAEAFMLGGSEALESSIVNFQQTLLAIRYAPVPVIAATFGYVLGGGCELMMHCDQAVSALESYIGLVEVGVGLIPGAGGSKEMALRASQAQDPTKALQDYYKNIAMAEVATSAKMAQQFGYLRPNDTVVMNTKEVLHVAKQTLMAIASQPYQPPKPSRFIAQGMPARAAIEMFLINLLKGQQISEHDYLITSGLARIMTGGDIDANCEVDENWILKLERQLFLQLVETDKTQERVQHMLETGKPLRN